jgi:pimeloyl-ACP methyl ester carboxylesterase
MAADASVYRSKVDLWLAVVLVGTLAVSLVAVYGMLRSGSPGEMIVAAFTILLLAGVGALVVPIRYTIGATELVVRAGVMRIRIPLDRIRRVYPSRSLVSSPALSLDRLAVEYRAGPYSRPTVYISPERQEQFLRELAEAAGLELRGVQWVRAKRSRRGRGRCLGSIAVLIATCVLGSADAAEAQDRVTFPTSDGGIVVADRYGAGEKAVVLAHGGRFDRASWAAQAAALAAAGFTVLAIDFRGYDHSRGPGDADPMSAPLHLDLLAAVGYLRAGGATAVHLVGASMGGDAAADAVAGSEAGEIDGLVLLGSGAGAAPERVDVRTLFIVAREDTSGSGPRLPRIREHFDRVTGTKELLVLEGSAHAQFLFDTGHADRVMREILRFLSAP